MTEQYLSDMEFWEDISLQLSTHILVINVRIEDK